MKGIWVEKMASFSSSPSCCVSAMLANGLWPALLLCVVDVADVDFIALKFPWPRKYCKEVRYALAIFACWK